MESLIFFFFVVEIVGAEEGQGSPTVVEARKIWRRQAEEEGKVMDLGFELSLVS